MTEPIRYRELRAQPGFQVQALSTPADIAILGGAAGCGKTGALLLEFLRHVEKKGWGGTVFRREFIQIDSEGGLWDSAKKLYQDLHPVIRPTFIDGKKRIYFPSGAKLTFAHINQEQDVHKYQGSQIKFIAFDELTHFTAYQFFYMLSRNRGAGVKIDSYVRATCNPQGSGWVKDFIAWWLYPADHADESLADYPIPERAGVLRYLARYANQNYWGDTRQQAFEALPEQARWSEENPNGISLADIKSVTFIPGKLDDNKILLEAEPGYKGSLLQLDENEQEQLLKGRWRELSGHERILYDVRALEDMFTNTFVEPGINYLTCDIAMEGADKFVVIHWSGWRAEHIYFYPKSKGDEIVNIIKELATRHQVSRRNIAFDCDGVGNFLKGFLRNSYDYRSGAVPLPVKNKKVNYFNLRAQSYYELRDIINNNEIYINAGQNSHLKDTIKEELKATLKGETKADGKLRVIPKDEIKAVIHRSPDFADCIAMRVALELRGKGIRPEAVTA